MENTATANNPVTANVLFWMPVGAVIRYVQTVVGIDYDMLAFRIADGEDGEGYFRVVGMDPTDCDRMTSTVTAAQLSDRINKEGGTLY